MSGFERHGEFISIGKGAIATEAISQQLEYDSFSSLALVQDREGVRELRRLKQRGSLHVDISDAAYIDGAADLADLDPQDPDNPLNGVEFAFEATPYDAHTMLSKVIPYLREQGIFTVMASKGFMVMHPSTAMEVYQAGYLGRDATLGGDAGIYPHFDEVSDDRTVSFEGIFNGTYSRTLELMRLGIREEEIVAIVGPDGEGLAEPGANTLLQIVHGEHGDNVGKAINAYNFGVLVNQSGEIDEGDLAQLDKARIVEITADQVKELFENPEDMAYVVNWHRDGSEIPEEYYDENKAIGVFTLPVGESGLIVGSFRKLTNKSPMHVITQSSGPLNGVAIYKKVKGGSGLELPYIKLGLGAGPVPTAHRMVLNAANMRARHNTFRFIG